MTVASAARNAFILSLVVAIAGCAGREPRQLTIYRLEDNQRSCASLQEELKSLDRAITYLESEERRNANDAYLVALLSTISPPSVLTYDNRRAAAMEKPKIEERRRLIENIFEAKCTY